MDQVREGELASFCACSKLPKALVLLHVDPPKSYRPLGTRAWIEANRDIQRQLHVSHSL